MAQPIRILSVGYDRNLMSSRSLLLRSAGYLVEEAYSRDDAIAIACSDMIGLVLVCHTVPEDEKAAIISAVRKQESLVPIICIADHDYYQLRADACSVVSNTPAELLAAVSSHATRHPAQ